MVYIKIASTNNYYKKYGLLTKINNNVSIGGSAKVTIAKFVLLKSRASTYSAISALSVSILTNQDRNQLINLLIGGVFNLTYQLYFVKQLNTS